MKALVHCIVRCICIESNQIFDRRQCAFDVNMLWIVAAVSLQRALESLETWSYWFNLELFEIFHIVIIGCCCIVHCTGNERNWCLFSENQCEIALWVSISNSWPGYEQMTNSCHNANAIAIGWICTLNKHFLNKTIMCAEWIQIQNSISNPFERFSLLWHSINTIETGDCWITMHIWWASVLILRQLL